MSFESVVVVGHLKTTSKEARDKTIKQFEAIVKYSEAQEPGVHRYAITVPTDETDDTTIYAIEEYASQKASDDHLATSPVQELIALFGSQPAVLADAPVVYTFGYVGDKVFSRPELQNHPNGFVVMSFAKLETEEKARKLTEALGSVLKQTKATELETLWYGVMYSRSDETQLGIIEAYIDKDAFDNHCNSKAVADVLKVAKGLEAQMHFVTLKMATGWLSR